MAPSRAIFLGHIVNVSDLLEAREATTAIVHYRHPSKIGDGYHQGMAPQNPALLLQATFRTDKVSPSKKFIRLGDTAGDEIVGWTRMEWLEVVEVLGQASIADGKVTVTPIKTVQELAA